MTTTEAAYIAAVDARLQAVHEGGASSFGAVLSEALGADPVLVAERLRALELPLHADAPALPWIAWEPELHPLRCEWYFTSATAVSLARRFARARTVCLGAPLVAASHVGTIAVDRDATTLRRRFPGALGAIVELDLASATELPIRSVDAAIVDPPWYPPHMTRWLTLAASVVRPGGRIAMVLPPALQRPEVQAQRHAVEALAATLGPHAVEAAGVRYATPQYEHLAMAAAGLRVPASWRAADLLVVEVEQRLITPVPPPAPLQRVHDTFVIGTQVVTLARDCLGGPTTIEPIEGTHAFAWDRVTTRDHRIATIDLWTSRSRVASVRGGETVASALRQLAAGGSLDDAMLRGDAREHLAAVLGPPPHRSGS